MQSYKKKLICVPFWHNLFFGQEDMEHEFIYLWAKTYFYDFKIIPENMRPESIPNFRAEKYLAEFW